MKSFLLLVAASLCFLAPSSAPQEPAGFPGLAAGRKPQVEIAWNRFYDYHEVLELMDTLEARWPRLLSQEVIGYSVENREMRVYTLTNVTAGRPSTKPAMWIDGNIHGNEVQGSEVIVYLAWYLLENRESNAEVAQLLDDYTFYLLPSMNPDGRAHWFQRGHSGSSSRSGVYPVDSDRDGMFDEDPTNDLDGDGSITRMRKYVPGEGTHRLDPADPRIMVPVATDGTEPPGDWILLGSEGIDDDGDGLINEDGIGGYDMNRSWPSMWQPQHVQYGAGPYPLYWPETRNVARFLYAHRNVAGLQSFHNAGGMILRGPGAESFGEYPREDLRVFDEIGERGEKMLPFYRYMILWKDLYTVFGGFATWGYEGLGVISFTNELWTSKRNSPDERLDRRDQHDRMWFDDHLLMGEGFVEWHPYEHPLYGEVEIGGFQKDVGRIPPSFLIEEMLHRNALFCIDHARAMPRITIRPPEVTNLGGDIYAIDVIFENEQAIPTRTAHAARRAIGFPDIFKLEGGDLEVLAGGFRTDRFRPEQLELQDFEPARLVRDAGIGRREKLRVRWIVRGDGPALILYESEKATDRDLVFEIE